MGLEACIRSCTYSWPIVSAHLAIPQHSGSAEVPGNRDIAKLFILKHAASLKRLSIDRCGSLYRNDEDLVKNKQAGGGVKHMLTSFREQLKLEKFEILFSPSDQNLYDQDWNPIGREVNDTEWRSHSGVRPVDRFCSRITFLESVHGRW
jgi:hypothetical protein